jgi:thiol-disulfide isomerase/thioredoxin
MLHRPGRIIIVTALGLSACGSNNSTKDSAKQGSEPRLISMAGHLTLSQGESAVLNFELDYQESANDTTITIYNGEEAIRLANIRVVNDSIEAPFPVFDSRLRFVWTGSLISGYWYNGAKGPYYKVPFHAEPKAENKDNSCPEALSGSWRVLFSPGTTGEYPAVGSFVQNGCIVNGTFMTETGDYRFLQGKIHGDSLSIGCLDGSHAFLFKATINGDTINGTFWSGKHWSEPWTAVKDDHASLRHPDSITVATNEAGSGIGFRATQLDGTEFQFNAADYAGNVVILQIMGSWCPNCMDETAYLTEVHNKYSGLGLEVFALGFENAKGKKALDLLKGLKDHYHSQYPFLLAGDASKDAASLVFPSLNRIVSFPTTIYLDKAGRIRKVYTGFYGPGTGQYYPEFVAKNRLFIESLLAE